MKQIPIGPFGYCQGGFAHFGFYSGDDGSRLDNEPAISIRAGNGEPLAIATVRLQEPPRPGHVWLKGWSENEGVPQALAAAGIVELTGEVSVTGYVQAEEGKLTPLALEAIEAARPGS